MFKSIYFHTRIFITMGVAALLFAFSYRFVWCYLLAQIVLGILALGILIDLIWLYEPRVKFKLQRNLPKIFSLSDANRVFIEIVNESKSNFSFTFIDELPFEFQERNFSLEGNIKAGEEQKLQYELRPTSRGAYTFGNALLYIKTPLSLVERQVAFDLEEEIAVYPSVIQMKKYALYALDKISAQMGIKKMRRIGHSYEFEQIKPYTNGDDYRNINWKASSRTNDLMVNQYEIEKSQQIYCIIDKSRNMMLPFNGLTLMDYAINTTLTISNIALQKHDKAGLITFSDKIGAALKADNQNRQLHKILESLYREEERRVEANYDLLHQIAQKVIRGRCLFLLFMNFENPQALERVLPILRQINQTHLLLVVFFENTEIKAFSEGLTQKLSAVYETTIAEKFLYEKHQMAIKLRQYGIQSVLTKPEDLSVNTINKYLELKARGLL